MKPSQPFRTIALSAAVTCLLAGCSPTGTGTPDAPETPGSTPDTGRDTVELTPFVPPPPPPPPDILVEDDGSTVRKDEPILTDSPYWKGYDSGPSSYDPHACHDQGDIIHPDMVMPFDYLVACPKDNDTVHCDPNSSNGWAPIEWAHVYLQPGVLQIDPPRGIGQEVVYTWRGPNRRIRPDASAPADHVPNALCEALTGDRMRAKFVGGPNRQVQMIGYGRKDNP
jgi:hypothetical protein